MGTYNNFFKAFVLDVPQTLSNATSISAFFNKQKLISPILLLTCVAFLLVWYLQYLWKRRYMYLHSWNVPGPLCFPFIGCAYLFFASTTRDIIETILEQQKKYPDLCKVWFGSKLIYLISRPEHIERILTSPKALEKDDLYRFMSFFSDESLISAKAPKWKKHRKVIMPAFNQRILDSFQAIFLKKGEVFANNLRKEVGNKDLDLFTLISNCTLDIICETSMGIDMNIQNSNSDFGKNIDKMMEITICRIFNIMQHLDFVWHWYPISKEYDRLLKKFKDFTGSIVKKRMEDYNEKKNRKNSMEDAKEDKTLAFLDLILENSNFTEEELREEVDLFMIAGTDATASSLSCLFLVLGMYPDVQEKVYEEILAVLGPDRGPLPADLPEMNYTERVIKESLRILPVAAFLLRKIAEDIEVGDTVFPAGSSALFNPVHIHRNPMYWKDPLKFDPDRFLPENIAERHPCTYIPFSYGPRNCIGLRFALMNIKTIVAIVIRKFKIFTKYKSIEEVELKSNIVLKLTDGPKVWVEAR